jgi:RHS repeat-associated protein
MLMPEREYSSGNLYRYGFNGKERDNEIKGEGNQYDYGFRIYDPRLGRFLSTDPLSAKYPWYSPYQFAGNKPIQCVDLDGAEERIPYVQSEAFDKISNPPFNENYIRGKKGDDCKHLTRWKI